MSLNLGTLAKASLLAACGLNCWNANGLAQRPGAVERTAFTMGTTLTARAVSDSRAVTIAAMEAGFAEVRRLEDVLSSWRADTEIGRINRAQPESLVVISTELRALLAEAGQWVEMTGGAFDPAVGALIDAWGFRSTPRLPDDSVLARALATSRWSQLTFADAQHIRRGPAGWWLDTGGFGKGAALRSLAAVMQGRGVTDALLDFGGQLLVFGEARTIAVADPRAREEAVLNLRVRDVSVATSSQSERFIDLAGRRYGHILDPRNGQPVPAWGSVTVVARDALAADALSTALFVLGPVAALRWAEVHPEFGVLVLESQAGHQVRAAWSRGMQQYIKEN